ncbi:hypothetical protein PR048_000067 [Dryococelus australis]|uniref:Uncharacterized protein n=1 Tax=Dryococelus australis TaxID=614101 RepID=A0ABQ9IEV4_9NEOP|nr:hypothetical protein PR048_000067 [Dryococelus australis]
MLHRRSLLARLPVGDSRGFITAMLVHVAQTFPNAELYIAKISERGIYIHSIAVVFHLDIRKMVLKPNKVFRRAQAKKRGSDEGDNATLIRCLITAESKALDSRAAFSSHRAYPWQFQRRPCYFIGGKSIGSSTNGVHIYYKPHTAHPPRVPNANCCRVIGISHGGSYSGWYTGSCTRAYRCLYKNHQVQLQVSCNIGFRYHLIPSCSQSKCGLACILYPVPARCWPSGLRLQPHGTPLHMFLVRYTCRAGPRCPSRQTKPPPHPRAPTRHGEPGSIPGGVARGFSQVRIVIDSAVRQRIFSVISHFPQPYIPALLHTHLSSPSSALKAWMPCVNSPGPSHDPGRGAFPRPASSRGRSHDGGVRSPLISLQDDTVSGIKFKVLSWSSPEELRESVATSLLVALDMEQALPRVSVVVLAYSRPYRHRVYVNNLGEVSPNIGNFAVSPLLAMAARDLSQVIYIHQMSARARMRQNRHVSSTYLPASEKLEVTVNGLYIPSPSRCFITAGCDFEALNVAQQVFLSYTTHRSWDLVVGENRLCEESERMLPEAQVLTAPGTASPHDTDVQRVACPTSCRGTLLSKIEITNTCPLQPFDPALGSS